MQYIPFYVNKFCENYPKQGKILKMLFSETLPDAIPYSTNIKRVEKLVHDYFNFTISFHNTQTNIEKELLRISPDYIYIDKLEAGVIHCDIFDTPSKNTHHIWMEHTDEHVYTATILHEIGHYIDFIQDKLGNKNSTYWTAVKNGYEPSAYINTNEISANANALALSLVLGIPLLTMAIFVAVDSTTDQESFRMLHELSLKFSGCSNQVLLNMYDPNVALVTTGNNKITDNVTVVSELASWLIQ